MRTIKVKTISNQIGIPHDKKIMNLTLREMFYLVYKHFAQNTSAHGFSWTIGVSPCSLRGVISILLVIFALISVSITILKSTSEYLFQISYQTRFDLEEENMEEFYMPDFVICHSSPWSIQKAQSLNISIELLSYITVALNPYDAITDLMPGRTEIYKRLEVDFEKLLKESFDGNFRSLLDAVTVDCSDFVRLCKMGAFGTWKECCGNVFNLKGIYSFDGKCFTTKGVMSHRPLIASSFDAVQVLMLMDRQDPFEQLDGSIAIWSASSLRGVTFAVVDANDDPIVALYNSEFISYGVMTRTKLKKTIINRGGINCFNNAGSNYSQKNCQMREVIQEVQKNLACTPIGLLLSDSESSHFKYCSPFESLKFLNDSKVSVSNSPNPSLYTSRMDHKTLLQTFGRVHSNGKATCQSECIYTTHESRVSTQLLQNNYYRKKLEKPSLELLLHTIYYPSFQFGKVTHVPRGIVDWLGDVGGNCGFYLGASLFSIIEFFYFVLKVFILCIMSVFGCSIAKIYRAQQEVGISNEEVPGTQ